MQLGKNNRLSFAAPRAIPGYSGQALEFQRTVACPTVSGAPCGVGSESETAMRRAMTTPLTARQLHSAAPWASSRRRLHGGGGAFVVAPAVAPLPRREIKTEMRCGAIRREGHGTGRRGSGSSSGPDDDRGYVDSGEAGLARLWSALRIVDSDQERRCKLAVGRYKLTHAHSWLTPC